MIEIVCACAIAFGFTGLLVYNISIYRELHTARRETSRFPLFAARDKIIDLVASGRMSESDASWQRVYQSVNSLLNMNQRLHLYDYIMRCANYEVRIARDEEFRAARKRDTDADLDTAKRVPEFAECMNEIVSGMHHMIKRRTSAWQRAAILVFVVTFVAISAGVKAATNAGRRLRQRSESDIGWWDTQNAN